jgi:two-component system sensor histidine kinase YesM
LSRESTKRKRWKDIPLGRKVLLAVVSIMLLMLVINIILYSQINKTIRRMDTVYSSNVDLTELSDSLSDVQEALYAYLSVKTSDSLENYYKSEQTYRNLLENLGNQISSNPTMLLERNIRKMSESYLALAEEAVSAKRGRNVEKYKELYDSSQNLYSYINTYIDELNSQQFRNNSASYQTLREALEYLEISSLVLMTVMMGIGILMLFGITKGMIEPLTNLAETANLVGQGNFNVKMPPTDSLDEVGIVTRAFNTMVESLEEYIIRTTRSMEKEQQMMERELLMKNHLKEAQLKYLQSQINPHFLFNSLNAGAQLAMLEDAEKTCIFVEKMADFFRYNVKKGLEDASLEEELAAVENYIYILNVRFAGEIHFTRQADERIMDCRVPSMILQPIVENAVNHGIRNIDWEGCIHLEIMEEEGRIFIRIRDNGKGMSQERIQEVLSGQAGDGEEQSDSTGVGMNNVISRLELYYNQKNLVEIRSRGENKGTEVILKLPKTGGQK